MIWIVQLLCPARHCVIAAAFDPEVDSDEETTRKLEEWREKLGLNPWCGICGSTRLRYESHRTKFQTMEEALPSLKKSEQEQALTREYLARLPKGN